MAVIKNQKTGMWEVRTYYKDWTGTRRQKTKRGLCTFISNGTVRYGCASRFRKGGAYQCQKKIEMQKTDGER